MNQSHARASASGCALMESLKASLPPQVFLCIPEPPHFWTLLLFRVTFSRSVPSKTLTLFHDISTAAPTQPFLLASPNHTHSLTHRVSVREWQTMVLLFLSLCQQEGNCFKDGKLSKTRSVDIYPIVLVLAPRKFRSAPFLMTEAKKKKLRSSHWPCFQPWEESLSAVKERERKMLSFRMQKKREESILTMVSGVSLLFQRLGWIPDLSEGLAALT